MRCVSILAIVLTAAALAETIPTTVGARAWKINHSGIAGCFEELGTQPWTSGEFFQAGGASGTILAAASHYGKGASNDAYGPPPNHRFVDRPRLMQVLDREFKDCLRYARAPGQELPSQTRLFAFADTVATRVDKPGSGWVGLRFRLHPNSDYAEGGFNDIVMKVKLLGQGPGEQARDLGHLGVNLIYSAYYSSGSLPAFLASLAAEVNTPSRRAVQIDTLTMQGPDLPRVDKETIARELVTAGLHP